jgi:excisionase family DNA binding protein
MNHEDQGHAYRTVPEVAMLLRVSRRHVRALIHRGELSAIQIGREYRIPNDALEAWIAEHQIKVSSTKAERR